MKNLAIKIFCLCLVLGISVASTTGLCAQGQQVYENTKLKVKISCPQGWSVTSGETVQKAVSSGINDITKVESIKESVQKLGVLVAFTQAPFGSAVEYNPTIMLSTEPLDPAYNIKTPMDIVKASIMSIRTVFKDVKIVKEPAPITVSGLEGATFTYQGTVVKGYLEMRLKSSAYIFIKDNIIYTLSTTDKADSLDANAKAFDYCLSTLTFE